MKALLLFTSTLAIQILPALAAPPPYYLGFDGNPAQAQMTETSSGSGIWQADVTFSAGRQEFYITGGSFSWYVPENGTSWLYANSAGTVRITYDANTYADGWLTASGRIGVSVEPGTWTAIGDFGTDNRGNSMSSLGNGLYVYQMLMSPGQHSFQAVMTGSFDAIGADGRRSQSAQSLYFNTTSDNPLANMYVDALNGTLHVDVTPVPEPGIAGLILCGGGIWAFWARKRS